MNHYETLGVPKSADGAAIKRAYRKRSRKAHPDRGGTNEEMSAVNRAYAVLSDESRRSKYDATGDDAERSGQDETLSVIAEAFTAMLQKDVKSDRVSWCIGFVRGKRNDLARESEAMRRAFEYLGAKAKDVEHKGDGPDMYGSIVEQEKRRIEHARAEVERRIGVLDRAIERLGKEYADKPAPLTTANLVSSGIYSPTNF